MHLEINTVARWAVAKPVKHFITVVVASNVFVWHLRHHRFRDCFVAAGLQLQHCSAFRLEVVVACVYT